MPTWVVFILLLLVTCQDQHDAVHALNYKLENLKYDILELRDLVRVVKEEGKMDILGNKDDLPTYRDTLKAMNDKLENIYALQSYADWDYETNITQENADEVSRINVKAASMIRDVTKQAKNILSEHLFRDSLIIKMIPKVMDLKRQLDFFSMNTNPKDDKDVEELQDVLQSLEKTYATAKVEKDGKMYTMEPDFTKLMAESRDPDELLWAWKSWRDVTGPPMKNQYEELVKYLNIGAKDNGYHNYADAWIDSQFFNTPDLEDMAEKLWGELKPLYQQLHAYVRRCLHKQYPNVVRETGPIPAHVLGNMWAQEWVNIYDLVIPYPDAKEHNVDQEMTDRNFTARHLFDMAEKFYTSIGLFRMTQTFWQKSMIVKPDDREVECHASAHDFYTKDDFRIKMCTVVNSEYLQTIHHEMGHIEYFMAYQNQPTVYRTGANSAFHEAIGDTIALSVMTTKHLQTLGLVPAETSESTMTKELGINFLMKTALFKLAFLPFGYMIDKWRYGVFRGKIKPENYNRVWWELRERYQGVMAPVERSEADFDPGAKFHIPSNAPYICYFVSFIIQFQFYEAMCNASGHTEELHTCDFYQSNDAGKLLKDMLMLGQQKPWPEAMEAITGQKSISTSSIRRYFAPLMKWLQEQNGETAGWD